MRAQNLSNADTQKIYSQNNLMMQLTNLTQNDAEKIQIYLQQFKNIQITTFQNVEFKKSNNEETKNNEKMFGKEIAISQSEDSKPIILSESDEDLMIIISGLGKDGANNVENILQESDVIKNGEDVCVFINNKNDLKELQKQFSEGQFQVVASNDKRYQNIVKFRSTLNWKRFTEQNAEYIVDSDAKVLVVVHSNSFESRQSETALAFAKHVAKTYIYDNENMLKFIVGYQLHSTFTEINKRNEITDQNGTRIQPEVYRYTNISPIIVAKMLVAIKDIEMVIKGLTAFDRPPLCSFVNPEIKKEIRKIDQSNETGNKETPIEEGEKKAPFIKDYKKKVPKTEDIINQIGEKKAEQFFVTLDLHEMPEGTAEKLEAAFKPRMPDCTFKTLAKGDLSIKCGKDKLEEVKKTIATVKVNSVALKFTEKTLK
ncbi:Conserved_hypothetical protein [Hexamita inflata]|uniref:Uncharacterized protein n=1 Tax=Hexamita inflata TaxID=28002 RepID=A0AA86QRI4_9EUKA|nr:Conserved hypothetical protein [Hexamita inflata]CAI9956705.1 Conserved hypothetical protein [Hexamita inflata]